MGYKSIIPAVTAEQMAKVDRLLIEEYGFLLSQLMENAGRNLAEQARRMLSGSINAKKIVVLCGTGNNGGGGMVAARHLHNRGAQVQVQLVGNESQLKDVPAQQWRILQKIEIPGATSTAERIEKPDLVIDAIIGYGLKGDARPSVADWIEWANRVQCPILALDLPSGLDATTGIPGNACIRATNTLTLALPKTGLLAAPAKPFVGDLFLADIGVPPELYPRLGFEVEAMFAQDMIIAID